VAGLLGLAALAVAVILVITLTAGGTTGPSAGPSSQMHPADLQPATPTVDPAVQSRTQARLAAKAARAARAARTERLFRQHGCWNGEAPAGAVPTHALVTLPGKRAALVSADVGYGIWLDGHTGQLHGFCP